MKKLLFLLFLSPLLVQAQQADLLIKNGKILDGTGNSWFYGDIAIQKGKILRIGNLSGWQAARTIDATGKMVAPGFIDVHTHIEDDERKNPTADNFIYDGVTSVITGNCGLSESNLGAYFSMIDSLKLSINVAALVGHNNVRKAVMGSANRHPTEKEMLAMEAIVNKAMKDGAVGLSTGLIYIPGTYSKTEEIVRLAKIAAAYHGVYASHMRDEGDSVTQAIEEALTIGREAKIPVEISHFKLSGQQNWGRSAQTIPMVIKAREEGLDVTIDQYPYTASSTSLSTLLPDWVLADGQDSIKARLARPAVRKEVVDYMLAKLKKRKLPHFSYPVVASYRPDSSYNGKSIEQVNLLRGNKHKPAAEAETVIQMMEQGGAGMVFHGMSDQDVKTIMQYPFNMFASDASIRIYKSGNPHPRGYGTNARVLGKYVREEKVISLEEAIRRMTSLPAQKFHLSDRGLLRDGFAADIVVFDAATVKDLSTYDQPHQYSTGFDYVLVNGIVTVDGGKHNGSRAGTVLRKSL
ncbi:MAG: aminoacylase [Bacteroidetes bacterium 24-39-8]|jgi:N-acyl-D-amino-acid deacylase|nr:MAG: aminoacylase [Sphingobacteriia bacterium 35-40-8]OYZ51642.1 MAG: aminoacylase [Bacteroidetes bacterium 24-39-8]OZA64262.1 MAG: aminoacylase [Sphingobacteriia bacterium 39-39-8]HQR93485.1 D-aminoacylase [Sediminibacterium sp.]HQS54909.1 D-aminoacylase [Sediminibacterium sp.]